MKILSNEIKDFYSAKGQKMELRHNLIMMFKLQSNSYRETINIGKKFSRVLEEKDVVVLEGSLGGGKTIFVKGILQGLGFRKRVLSPSFTLVRQYRAKGCYIHHIDLYRLDEPGIFDLGIEDFFYSEKSITLIEWGDKISKSLYRYIKIKFLFLNRDSRRLVFSVKGYNGSKIKSIREALKNEFIRS